MIGYDIIMMIIDLLLCLKNSCQVSRELCFLAQLLFTFQEYVDYYGGAGVQHIAMNTNDIIQTVMTNHNISD